MADGWSEAAEEEARALRAEARAEAEAPAVPTQAELLGMTAELGGAMLAVVRAEAEAGRLEVARTLAEGLVTANPHEAEGWALLSRIHRGLRQPLAARFAVEVAWRLAPDAPAVRLARAEVLLPDPEGREEARALLEGLAGEEGPEAERAAALLAAMGG
jgi:predicted Zn-dependent protease